MVDRKRERTESTPDRVIERVSERHPYGGVKPEPPAGIDIDTSKPEPRAAPRRPDGPAETPYREPRAKNRTPSET